MVVNTAVKAYSILTAKILEEWLSLNQFSLTKKRPRTPQQNIIKFSKISWSKNFVKTE